MIQCTNLILDELYRAYRFFNSTFFSNALPDVMITLSQEKKLPVTCSTQPIWLSKLDNSWLYEISLNPATFRDYDPVEIIASFLYGMCELSERIYSAEAGYDNISIDHLKGLAESNGLDLHKQRGGYTASPSDKLRECILSLFCLDTSLFDSYRIDPPKPPAKERKKSTFNYVCPGCGAVIKAKRTDLNIVCGDCRQRFELEEDDTESETSSLDSE